MNVPFSFARRPVIEYATGHTRQRAPRVFAPSLISIILMSLTTATALYLNYHNESWKWIRTTVLGPWNAATTTNGTGEQNALAGGGRLITMDGNNRFTIHDAKSGRLIHDVGNTVGSFPAIAGGPHPTGVLNAARTHALVVRLEAPNVLCFVNVDSGRCDRSISLPTAASQIMDFSQDEQIVVATRQLADPKTNPPTTRVELWSKSSSGSYVLLSSGIDTTEENVYWLSPHGETLYCRPKLPLVASAGVYSTADLSRVPWPPGLFLPNAFSSEGGQELAYQHQAH